MKLRGIFFSSAAVAFAIIGAFSIVSTVTAEERTPLTALTVDLTLQNDGLVRVHQTLDFAAASPLTWRLYSNARNLKVLADNQELNSDQIKEQSHNSQTVVQSAFEANSWVLEYLTSTTLIRHNDRDQIYFRVFEELGRTVSNVSISLHLPEDTLDPGLNGNIYAIGGVIGQATDVASTTTIHFQARYTGPKALLTVSANWPKSVLHLTTWQEWRLELSNLELIPWLVLGLFLPLAGLLVLVQLKIRVRLSERATKEVKNAPPSRLAPALVGVLVRKKIYPEEIGALMIDFCQRGYMVIVKKNHRYYLSQRKAADEHLEDWERQIFLQLFPDRNMAITENNFEANNQRLLFSPKIRDAFAQMYQVITAKRFFTENPHQTRVRYKLFALLLYFIGVGGALWTAVASQTPALLIPLMGTIVVAFLIIRLSPQLIHYSPEGGQIRLEWLAFKNFLVLKKALPLEVTQGQIFEKYLPYAVALNATTAWARRFDLSSVVIVRPDWFISFQDGSTVEFVKEVEEFTGVIAKEITSLRGPLVS
jgi:hypothetical protein